MIRTLRHCLVLFIVFSTYLRAEPQIFQSLKGTNIHVDFEQPKKATVLIFWASWCPYCMAEVPNLKRLNQTHPNIHWLGVNVNKNPDDGLTTEIERAMPYESIQDPKLVVTDLFGIRGTPGFIIIDVQGKVLFKGRRINDEFLLALNTLSKPDS